MNETCLELRNVSVVRSGRDILNVADIVIERGQFVNLIGTNGAGKTTLLKTVCGLIKPASGVVRLDGIDINKLSPWQKTNIRKRIGYIPQSAGYNGQLPFTVREVVAMGCAGSKPLTSRLNRNDYERIDLWIEELELSRQSGQTFGSLSGGEQQKVLIARAMVQNPSILLLDEPTSSLDFNWKYRIINIVQELRRRLELTVLLISHEINSIPLDADSTILLHQGRVAASGETQAVLTSPVIKEIYNCRIDIVDTDFGRTIVCCQDNGG